MSKARGQVSCVLVPMEDDGGFYWLYFRVDKGDGSKPEVKGYAMRAFTVRGIAEMLLDTLDKDLEECLKL